MAFDWEYAQHSADVARAGGIDAYISKLKETAASEQRSVDMMIGFGILAGLTVLSAGVGFLVRRHKEAKATTAEAEANLRHALADESQDSDEGDDE